MAQPLDETKSNNENNKKDDKGKDVQSKGCAEDEIYYLYDMEDKKEYQPVKFDETQLQTINFFVSMESNLPKWYEYPKPSKLRTVGPDVTEPIRPDMRYRPRYNLIQNKGKQIWPPAEGRKQPRYIADYDKSTSSIMIYLMGTEKVSQYDWLNAANIVPKTVQLDIDKKQIDIEMHGGIYNALNVDKFAKYILDDVRWFYQRSQNNAKSLVITGHSQGGAIAQALLILWKGRAKSPFTDYIRKELADNKEIKNPKNLETLFDNMAVMTIGSLSVVSHKNAAQISGLFGKDITNFILPSDPIPMMLNGESVKAPIEPIPPSKEDVSGFDLFSKLAKRFNLDQGYGMMQNYHLNPYYAPVGQYIVVFFDQKRLYRGFVAFKNEEDPLFVGHLKHGAETLHGKAGQITSIFNSATKHVHSYYKVTMDFIIGELTEDLKNAKNAKDNNNKARRVNYGQALISSHMGQNEYYLHHQSHIHHHRPQPLHDIDGYNKYDDHYVHYGTEPMSYSVFPLAILIFVFICATCLVINFAVSVTCFMFGNRMNTKVEHKTEVEHLGDEVNNV